MDTTDKKIFKCFNPRPCTRGDPFAVLDQIPRQVSIRAPARGATTNPCRHHCRERCFNPRPCTRGDAGRSPVLPPFPVSIRAPARGATSCRRLSGRRWLFQSAPLHEGRHGWSCWRFGVVCFNPRPCTRGDFGDAPVSQHIEVSIRAPARGATFGDNAGNTCRCFNPRPCTRGDFVHPVVGIKHYGFNPRPCTRGDVRVI